MVPGLGVQKYLEVDVTSSLGSDENGGSAREQCSAAVSRRRGWGVWEENKDEPVGLCLKKKKKSSSRLSQPGDSPTAQRLSQEHPFSQVLSGVCTRSRLSIGSWRPRTFRTQTPTELFLSVKVWWMLLTRLRRPDGLVPPPPRGASVEMAL